MAAGQGKVPDASSITNEVSQRLSDETVARIVEEFHLSDYGSMSSLVSRMKETLIHDRRLGKSVERVERQQRKPQN